MTAWHEQAARYHRVHCDGCQECRLTRRDIEAARDKMWATPHRGDTMLDRWADDGGPTNDEAEAVADEAERDRPEREEGPDGS
jgi:hypothetical protein